MPFRRRLIYPWHMPLHPQAALAIQRAGDLRGVADRLLGTICVLLQRRVLFDADHTKPAAA